MNFFSLKKDKEIFIWKWETLFNYKNEKYSNNVEYTEKFSDEFAKDKEYMNDSRKQRQKVVTCAKI